MGRRIFKKVYNGENLEKHLSFAYDGYKLIEERNALDNNAAVRKYVWQPEALDRDVPLTVYDVASDKTYYFHTDANKNVTKLSDESGNVVAHYEYSPFGSLTKLTGDYAGSNPFRFSSEYFDEETGLVYYNYRYYNPELGRWISRDPIEEQGGMNLYAFIRNNSITIFDNLGFSEEWPWTRRDWLTWPIHACFDFGAGLSHLGISFYNSINRMGNTDREKYHDDVMAGRANVTTQSPSTQKDMQIVGDTVVKSATSMPGTSVSGPPPTSISDIMSQAPAQAASESK